jgi:hypothetical protein
MSTRDETASARPAATADGFVAAERAHRLAKLDALAEGGVAPYAVRYDRDHAIGDVRARFADLPAGRETDQAVRLAGRVMLIRRHGGLVFADLTDQTGTIQLLGGRVVASGTSDELKAMVPAGRVELEFGEEAQLAAAQRVLGEQHEVDRVDSKLVVATGGSVAQMADLFIQLKDSGIEPTGFSRQLPTLDDVFFKFLDEDKEDRHASAR